MTIDKTDKDIDQMMYELYGLSEEEIRIVEEVRGGLANTIKSRQGVSK